MTTMIRIDEFIECHVPNYIATEHIKALVKEHWRKDPLKVTCGKAHECLDMTIDFGVKRGCITIQFDFIKKMWTGLLDDLRG